MRQESSLPLKSGAVYVGAILLLGLGVMAHSVRDLIQHPVGPEWLIPVGLTIASGWATLRIPTMPISFSISDTFIMAAALLFGPSAGAVTAGLDGLVLSYRMTSSRRSAQRILFNMAAPTIATWSAAHVFFFLAGSGPLLEGALGALRLLGMLTVFGVIVFGLNTGIVATAVSFERHLPILAVWREHFLGLWVSYFGGVFGAMLLLVLTRQNSSDVLVLIVPLPVILYVTFKHALGRAQDQIDHLGKVNRVYVAAIEALAQAVDAKDQVTHDHVRRVQDQSVRLARVLGVDEDSGVQALNAASLLHDVGKLAIPEHILNKPGRLTPAEYEIMKRHAAIGADILSVIGLPYAVSPIVRHHHENWDGTGYPDGLAGDRIPIGARILAVVDCFDALTSDRPYRPRLPEHEALQIVASRRGTMYDPRVVDSFLALHEEAAGDSAPVSQPSPPAAVPEPAQPTGGLPTEEGLDLRAFFELGRALGASEHAALGETVWEHLRPLLPPSLFVLYAYEGGSDALRAAYVSDVVGGRDHAQRIPLGERLSGWVAATCQTIVNSDPRLDFDVPGADDCPLRSTLAVAIIEDGRAVGVLSFYSVEPNAFADGHRRIAEAAACAIAEATVSLVPVELARRGRGQAPK